MRKFSLICVLIAIFPYFANAAFTEIGAGARPLGMGGAFSAVADDANATLWNPAGLCQLSHFQLSTMAVKLYGLDVGSQFISLCSGDLWESGAIGVSALMLGEAGLYSETSYVISVSQDLTPLLNDKLPISAGINLKRLRVGYSGYDRADPLFANSDAASVYGTTFDLGFIYQVTKEIKSAIVIQNVLSPTLSINENEEVEEGDNNLARIFRLGGAYTSYRDKAPEQLCFAAEYCQQVLADGFIARSFKLGSEIWWDLSMLESQVAIRIGTEIAGAEKDRVLTLGGGYRCILSKIGLEFNYALCYSVNKDLGNAHRFSLTVAY